MIKFKENDIYALEIKDNISEYNGKYIILIKGNVEKWPNKFNNKLFRFKMTKDKTIPSLDEIENLDYIKIHCLSYVETLPKLIAKEELNKEYKEKLNLAKNNGDEYGYYYTYLCEIYHTKDDNYSDLIYLGNRKLSKPNDEYIPNSIYDGNIIHTFHSEITEFAVDAYKRYNLKQDISFQEAMPEKRARAIISNVIYFAQAFEQVKKEIAEGKTYKNKNSESLTYVGGKDHDPFEK